MTEPAVIAVDGSPAVEHLPLADAGGVVDEFVIDRDWLAQGVELGLGPESWGEFRKKVTTRATRITGPFVVETSEGPLHCSDGWVAVDARGFPYPIAADEFELIYERVS